VSPVLLVLAVPLIGAVLLAALPGGRHDPAINAVVSGLTLAAALGLFAAGPMATSFVLLDDLNLYLVALTAFVGFTTSLFSARYIGHEIAAGRLSHGYLRFYHALYQGFVAAMLMALLANNLGLMWVAVESATLITVPMVGLARTRPALEAAWKYFILCGVGIALALFGTILLYLAAQPVLGEGMAAMTWTALITAAPRLPPELLDLAFVFLLIGYGTKVGLAPMHAWLPDAHAEGPTPISAVLSGLLLNVALAAVLRFKLLMTANGHTLSPGPLMVLLGLISVGFAGLMLYRRRDIKRLFAYSSIEHMGVITFAFGIGGPLANFGGLLHMAMHSLTKSAIFFVVGHVVQAKGTQRVAEIRGLTTSHPLLGWTLVIGVVAIAGLPPFGIFQAEFLILTSTFVRAPILALLLGLALLLAFATMLARLQALAFGPADSPRGGSGLSLVPAWLHLGLVLVAGLALPGPVVRWFESVARLLG
jgi:hydrogenase-4 component F